MWPNQEFLIVKLHPKKHFNKQVKEPFLKGTHPCQHNYSKATRDLDKRFCISCTQVNLWYGKLFVFTKSTGSTVIDFKTESSGVRISIYCLGTIFFRLF